MIDLNQGTNGVALDEMLANGFTGFTESITSIGDSLTEFREIAARFLEDNPAPPAQPGFVCVDPVRQVFLPARLVQKRQKVRDKEERFQYVTKPHRPPIYNRLQHK